MVDLGDAKITISAEDKTQKAFTKINKSSKNMAANFKKAGLAMAAVGAGLVLAIGKMVTSYAKAGDEVAKMAKRTGFGTEALSELRHVAQITGTELGSIEKATKRMSRAIIDADRGLETYARAFRELGLNITELRAMKPEEQFWAIAGAIGDLEDQTLKAALAQEIFGRAGTELLPMLGETKEAIAALRQEAHDLGIVFDEEAAAAAEEMVDAQTRLKAAMTGLSNTIAKTLMPHIQELVDSLTEKLKPAMEWLEEHPEVTEAFAKFALALTGAGGVILAVMGVIKVIKLLSAAVIAVRTALITMQAFMGPAGWAVLAAGAGIAMATIAAVRELTEEPAAELGGAGGIQTTAAFGEAKPPAPPGKYWFSTGTRYELRNLPGFQFGGIVPGPIGQPVPIMAHGGEVFAGVGGRMGTTIYLNVEGSVVTEDNLISSIRRAFILEGERNTSTGIV